MVDVTSRFALIDLDRQFSMHYASSQCIMRERRCAQGSDRDRRAEWQWQAGDEMLRSRRPRQCTASVQALMTPATHLASSGKPRGPTPTASEALGGAGGVGWGYTGFVTCEYYCQMTYCGYH